MRTTVQLAPELMRAAKSEAAERGESLKALITRAVAAEVGRTATSRSAPARLRLPLFGQAAGPRVEFANADVDRALGDDDAARARSNDNTRSKPPRRRRSN